MNKRTNGFVVSRSWVLAALMAMCGTAARAGDALSDGFRSPSASARPHTWWHWMNGNVSKAGITVDLEAMARVGLGGVQVFDAGLTIPEGTVALDTPAWYDHLVFAAKEAQRLGLSFGIANCSGWTSSGGPWDVTFCAPGSKAAFRSKFVRRWRIGRRTQTKTSAISPARRRMRRRLRGGCES